jgi:hypothetical protein
MTFVDCVWGINGNVGKYGDNLKIIFTNIYIYGEPEAPD